MQCKLAIARFNLVIGSRNASLGEKIIILKFEELNGNVVGEVK